MNIPLNELTKRLYAAGHTREDHPPDVYWRDYKNLGYKFETTLGFTWETPCGLLIRGDSLLGRGLGFEDATFQGVWYCPENDNPLLRCPLEQRSCPHIPTGLPLPMCPCHQTDRAYDHDLSAEKIVEERDRKKHRQYMEITGGSYCACVVTNNGYEGGYVEIRYDVMSCIQYGCKNPFCVIRKQSRDLSRVNIFYDIRRIWTTRVGFLEDRRVEITKGVKVFPRAVARTDAEIWLKTREAEYDPLHDQSIIDRPRKTPEDRRQEHFSKAHRRYANYDYFEFEYKVENIRIARSCQRDLLQDLQDAADGIEVVHAADQMKATAAEKRAGRERRQKQKLRRRQDAYLAMGTEQLSLFGGQNGSDQEI